MAAVRAIALSCAVAFARTKTALGEAPNERLITSSRTCVVGALVPGRRGSAGREKASE